MIDVMAGADPIRALNAQRLSQARKRYGYTLRELAIEVENVRKLRGDADLPTQESLPQKNRPDRADRDARPGVA